MSDGRTAEGSSQGCVDEAPDKEGGEDGGPEVGDGPVQAVYEGGGGTPSEDEEGVAAHGDEAPESGEGDLDRVVEEEEGGDVVKVGLGGLGAFDEGA